MHWLERIGQRPPRAPEDDDAAPSSPPRSERAAPGLAALFEGLHEDGRHSILDLGPGDSHHFRLYQPFAHQIRFAGLVPVPPTGPELKAALDALPPNDRVPYDVVLAWDILDRIGPDDRTAFVKRLVEVTAPGARLYASVDATESATTQPVRSIIVDYGRIASEAVGAPHAAEPRLLPAPLERLIAPFEVLSAFSLRAGRREYVARR